MAQQQIITKPYVGELQDDDSLFINHDGALRQVKKKDADFASSEYVRTYVDNATVASAQKATNDSDGNAINATYRKVADSYNKSEIDTKLTGKADSATLDAKQDKLTFDSEPTKDSTNAITSGGVYKALEGKSTGSGKTYTFTDDTATDSDGNAQAVTVTKVNGHSVEANVPADAKFTDTVYDDTEIKTRLDGKANKATSLSGYGITDAYTKTQTDDLLAKKASASHTHTKSQITDMPTKLSQFTNDKGFKKITWSTITIATSAWSNNTATVSVSGVTASNAVDVAPVEPTFDAYINAGIRATSQGSGTLTFACKTVPTVAISVNVKVYN